MAGKGDKPRKVDKKKYDENYDRIFRQSTSEEEVLEQLEENIGLKLSGIRSFLHENEPKRTSS